MTAYKQIRNASPEAFRLDNTSHDGALALLLTDRNIRPLVANDEILAVGEGQNQPSLSDTVDGVFDAVGGELSPWSKSVCDL